VSHPVCFSLSAPVRRAMWDTPRGTDNKSLPRFRASSAFSCHPPFMLRQKGMDAETRVSPSVLALAYHHDTLQLPCLRRIQRPCGILFIMRPSGSTYIIDHYAAGSGLFTYILLPDLRVLLPLALSAPPGLGLPPHSDLYRDAFALPETRTTLRAGPALCICTPRHRSRRQCRCGRSQGMAD
jgi:hypothetical protein